jgi:hypothetical protein
MSLSLKGLHIIYVLFDGYRYRYRYRRVPSEVLGVFISKNKTTAESSPVNECNLFYKLTVC